MWVTRNDGIVAKSPEQAQQLEAAGYHQCDSLINNYKQQVRYRCPFFLSPETIAAVQEHNGYYNCPVCHRNHDLLHELPWHGVRYEDGDPVEFEPGGGTKIGLSMETQAQIGEDLVEALKEIPGYGPIVWWHQGGATGQSPLDGATQDWGIEVKTIGYDALHHRFIPGREQEKINKNNQAQELGKKGVLAVLVMLDYRRSLADIYIREQPLASWINAQGNPMPGGVASFRRDPRWRLLEEVPFRNPLMNPHDPSPAVAQPDMPF